MTPTTLLFGQMLVVFAVVLGGVWAATQLVAGDLGFQTRLGATSSRRAGRAAR